MKRLSLAGMLVVCLSLSGCGGGSDETAVAEKDPEVTGRGTDAPGLVTATGCLTASGDRFVLTELQPGTAGPSAGAGQPQGAGAATGAQPTTESYQLIGDEDELRRHVGQQVRITGSADTPKVAEVRETTPTTSPRDAAAGTTGGSEPAKPGEPQVSTSTETRLEVTQLRVETVSATGQACQTAGQQPQR